MLLAIFIAVCFLIGITFVSHISIYSHIKFLRDRYTESRETDLERYTKSQYGNYPRRDNL